MLEMVNDATRRLLHKLLVDKVYNVIWMFADLNYNWETIVLGNQSFADLAWLAMVIFALECTQKSLKTHATPVWHVLKALALLEDAQNNDLFHVSQIVIALDPTTVFAISLLVLWEDTVRMDTWLLKQNFSNV
jgi:hypothetical protein